jgi:hypothetical protein
MPEIPVFPPVIRPEMLIAIEQAPAGRERLEFIADNHDTPKWNAYPGEHGTGWITFTVMPPSSKESGLVCAITVIINDAYPRHKHNGGGCFGEKTGTYLGALHDTEDDGKPIILLPGMEIIHAGESIHEPHARNDGFWMGWFLQPRGSKIMRL